MIITFTKAEAMEILKKALNDNHQNLLVEAGLEQDFAIGISNYDDKAFMVLSNPEITKEDK